MTEEWRTIAGWPDYAVSNLGRVRRLSSRTCAKAGAILKATRRSKGRPYLCVCLCRDGQTSVRAVHVLVAEAFLGVRPKGQVPNHQDGDPTNNRASNLKWETQSRNVQHAYELGLADATGENNGQSVLTEADVIAIRSSYTGARGQQSAMSRAYGVNPTTIRDVIKRRTWTHV